MAAMIILLLLCVAAAITVNPMPSPRNITWGEEGPIFIDVEQLTLSCYFNSIEFHDNIIFDAFDRCVDTVVLLKWKPLSFDRQSYEVPYEVASYEYFFDGPSFFPINSIQVTVADPEAPLELKVKEDYHLVINRNGISIESLTKWGVLHALTTLQQLIVYDSSYYIESSVTIFDEPLFVHRGLMIDSSRNFLTVRSILDQIEIMALVKMNTLHWHLTDSQSWPVQLESFPEMTNGEFLLDETYSGDEIRDIVEYAMARGIRIVPEIDTPGHSRAGWIEVNRDIVTCADTWWNHEGVSVEPPPGQLDILRNETYVIVTKVFNEVSSFFKDSVLHVGLDELQFGCYQSSNLVRDWFAANSSRTSRDLVQYWVDRAVPIFLSKVSRLTMWEDVITDRNGAYDVPKDVILQSWNNGMKNVKKITSRGYDVIVSSADHLYLDCGFGGWVSNDPRYVDHENNTEFNSGNGGSWCAPYKTWQRIYSYDITFNLTEAEAAHVLGAECPLFSEQVDSVTLTSTIWPRTAALAEMTWSGNKDENGNLRTKEVTSRILNLREYLVKLRYLASALMPKYCVYHPHECDFTK